MQSNDEVQTRSSLMADRNSDPLGARSLVTDIDQAIPLIEAADALLEKLNGESRPTSSDAREGLRLRLSLVNVIDAIRAGDYLPEHTIVRDSAATVLEFYLHMLTNLFQVRFSTLDRNQYTVLNRAAGTSPTLQKMLALRLELQGSRPDEQQKALSPWAPPINANHPDPAVVRETRPVSPRTIWAIAVTGILFILAGLIGAIWVEALSQTSAAAAACTPQNCEPSHPIIYALTRGGPLVVPGILGAGLIWVFTALILRPLTVAAQPYQRAAATRAGAFRWLRATAEQLIWAPGVILVLVSVVATGYLIRPDRYLQQCDALGQCSLPDNFTFNEILQMWTPALLASGLVCIMTAALIRSLPRTETPDPELSAERHQKITDLEQFKRPQNVNIP